MKQKFKKIKNTEHKIYKKSFFLKILINKKKPGQFMPFFYNPKRISSQIALYFCKSCRKHAVCQRVLLCKTRVFFLYAFFYKPKRISSQTALYFCKSSPTSILSSTRSRSSGEYIGFFFVYFSAAVLTYGGNLRASRNSA